ncbi:hypothetical protein HY492_02820 [Candidatus Woesearchaeota archaeon]|nr:hypothetical protein [Candidatus Woesearchaeota archaeon]
MKRFTRQDVIDVLHGIDEELTGIQRKIKLYCIGGTVVTLEGKRDDSKDLDFFLSYQDFNAVTTAAAQVIWKKKAAIDFLPGGEFTHYKYPSYDAHAKKLPLTFKHLDVYRIDDADFVLTKALAGRPHDFDDIHCMATPDSVSKEALLERFKKIVPAPGKEHELQKKLHDFMHSFYRS